MAEITWPCWKTRNEADPRFDYGSDAFGPPPGTWAPDCGHAACVEDDQHCPEPSGFHDWDCPVATCRMSAANAVCEMDRGHDGNHRWDEDAQPPAAAPAAESAGAL